MVLDTARLRLRPFSADDVDAHTKLYEDPEVTRWLGSGPYASDEVRARSAQTVARFVDHWRTRGFGVFVVEDRATGRLIGQCGLNTLDMLGTPPPFEVEILWALERRMWGMGLGTEAASAALRHGFEVVRLPRIIAIAKPDNGPSRRIMEKLGLRYEQDVEIFGIQAVRYAAARP